MHIIIGLITAIAGFIWALNSLQNAGVDLNSFNPFTWARRRKWEKQLGTKPLHVLTDSMDAAALLVVAVAKEQGDITRETKLAILKTFESAFGLNRSKSLEMYSHSSYLLQGVFNVAEEVRHILKPSREQFQSSHTEKLLKMLKDVSELEGGPSDGQRGIVQAVAKELDVGEVVVGGW